MDYWQFRSRCPATGSSKTEIVNSSARHDAAVRIGIVRKVWRSNWMFNGFSIDVSGYWAFENLIMSERM